MTVDPSPGPATTVFTGGRVLTMDPAHRQAGAVVVRGDRIAAVGDRSLADAHPDATVVDLAGRTLVPGFIDAHNHLSVTALHPHWHDVSGAVDVDELLAGVRAQAEAEPEAAWIRVRGWDETRHGVSVTAADLDRLGLDRPVIVAHTTLHQCVVDSAGLAALGVGRTTPDPPGGQLGRTADGSPSGLLVEQAWSQAHDRSLAAYADPRRWGDHVVDRARTLLASGITAIHDAACAPAAEAVYRDLAAAGRLPLSVLAMPHAAALLTNGIGDRADGPVTGEGDEWFRIGPVKLFADGGVAIALDASVGGYRIVMGLLMPDLEVNAVAVARRGFRLAVHAIGNVGVDAALDAFRSAARAAGDGDHRFRIEHAGFTSRAQCRELAALGAVGVVQPGFVEHIGDQSGGTRFDDHRCLAFADLAEAGVVLAASSDDPCAPVPPLWGAARGVTRRSTAGAMLEPDQSVPFEDWLAAYTIGAAHAGGQEGERGSITPGKRADLVVLDGSLTADPTPTVAETWVAGRRVFAVRLSG